MYDTLLFHNFKFTAWKTLMVEQSCLVVSGRCIKLSCLIEIFGDFANLVVMFKRLLNLVGEILQWLLNLTCRISQCVIDSTWWQVWCLLLVGIYCAKFIGFYFQNREDVAICHNVLMSFISHSYMFSPPGGATMLMNKMAAMHDSKGLCH